MADEARAATLSGKSSCSLSHNVGPANNRRRRRRCLLERHFEPAFRRLATDRQFPRGSACSWLAQP